MKNLKITTLLVLLTAPILLMGQTNDSTSASTDDADAIATKLANPSAAIGKLGFNIDFGTFKGDLPNANGQKSSSLFFQPSLPIPQERFNIFIRPAFTLFFDHPIYNGVNDFEGSGVQFGDIGFDLAIGKATKKGLVLFGGLFGNLPTASDKNLKGQLSFGPEIAIGKLSKRLIGLILLTHKWDVEDDPNVKTNVTGGQYIIVVPLGKGRQLSSTPPFGYNWETEELTLPVGGGFTQTVKLGKMPFQFGAQYWYYVSQPDPFGPDWTIRVTLTPVVKLPW